MISGTNNDNVLTNVSFGDWAVNFAYASNRLAKKWITGPTNYAAANTSWQFFYSSNGLLDHILDPRGNTNILVQYDKYGRKTNEVDAIGRATVLEYGVPGKRQIRHPDPSTNQWVETYDRRGHILVQEDPLHNKTSYTYDDRGNRTSIPEPLGFTTYFGYDDRANVIARTNALGEISHWLFHSFFNKAIQEITPQPVDANGWTTWTNFYAYDERGNLTNPSDALGSLVRYAYATNGLVLASTDANGNTNRFFYNTNGFLVTSVDPEGYANSFLLNEVGWKLGETNALRQATLTGPI